jgi:hypothetical protein
MISLFYKALRNSVKSGATIKETSINRGVNNKMNLREKKKKKIANNAMMNVVEVDIEEALETSEDPLLLPEVTEVVVQENTNLVLKLVMAKVNSVETMTTALLEIVIVVVQVRQAIVAEMTDADIDK